MFRVLLSRSCRLTAQQELAAQTCSTDSCTCSRTIRGQEVMGTSFTHAAAQHTVVGDVCLAVFVIVFRNARVMFVSSEGGMDSVHYQLSIATGHETSSTKD